MDSETLLALAGPLMAAAVVVFLIGHVRRSAAARAAALDGLRRRRRWRVEDRPSTGSAPAVLTLAPEDGAWALAVTYPRKRPGGGRSQGWITFRAPQPRLPRGSLVVLPAVPGADPAAAPAAMAMLAGLPAGFLLAQVLGEDLSRGIGPLDPVPGDHRGITVMATPGTAPLPDTAAIARALADWPVPAGLVLDAEGLRLRQALPGEDVSGLEALADRGAQLAGRIAAAIG